MGFTQLSWSKNISNLGVLITQSFVHPVTKTELGQIMTELANSLIEWYKKLGHNSATRMFLEAEKCIPPVPKRTMWMINDILRTYCPI